MQLLERWSGHSLRDVAAAAQLAERRGLSGFAAMENAHEPFLPLAVAALHTQSLELWTAIAIAFNRSPMAIANAAFDLQEASRGRFVLGLGSQVKGHNERRFSVPWSAPVPRMREYIDALRAIWRCWELGEELKFRGEHYQFTLMTPNFSPPAMGLPMVPVTLAAVGPGMLRLAGEKGDGVQLHPFCTQRYLDRVVLPELDAGLHSGGQVRERFHVSGGGFIATGPDAETVDRIREFVRVRIAFYGSTRTYWPVLEQHDLLDLGAKLHEMSKRGAWQEMGAEVSDEVLELFTVSGTHREIAARIEERFAGRVDQLMA
ncbi:MAG: TIGR03617 family F420-dependent LLM class oxidoreductase, partial [Myxococcales bacterium]|nr:TIGR03617 family F420-dependent LLM class oxidoreductase [Myxococcales bacterium]